MLIKFKYLKDEFVWDQKEQFLLEVILTPLSLAGDNLL